MAMVTLHLSPPELAKMLDLPDQMIWSWITGRVRVPVWVERRIRADLDKLTEAAA